MKHGEIHLTRIYTDLHGLDSRGFKYMLHYIYINFNFLTLFYNC